MSVLPIPPENEFVRELKPGSRPRIHERIVPLGDMTLAFDSSWVRANLRESRRRLQSSIQQQPVQNLVLAGNGPSLNNTQWDTLDHQHLMVSNYAHLSAELISRASYWCVVNPYVAAQNPDLFEARPAATKFIPFWLAAWLKLDRNTILLPGTGDPAFSTDIRDRISVRSTVSYFALQIAAFLGYRRVALIGFDHYYAQPESVTEGVILEAVEGDPNHFDPSYFDGKLWQAADTFRMEHVYALARIAYEDQGREIINCTEPSNLTVFPKQALSAALSDPGPPSHIPSSRWPQKAEGFVRWLLSDGRTTGYVALMVAAVVAVVFALITSGVTVTAGAGIGVVSAGIIVVSQYWTARRQRVQREHYFRLLSVLRTVDASRKSSKPSNPRAP